MSYGVENDLQAIVIQSETILSKATTRAEWEQGKASILGPNGSLTRIAKDIGKLPKEDRPAFGQALNQTKKQVESLFKISIDSIEAKADLSTLGPKIDPSLPAIPSFIGGSHPLTNTRRKIVSIFRSFPIS